MTDTVTRDEVLDRHTFGEAVGGYTECSCGWPSKQQWMDGEHEVEHVLRDLADAGLLARDLPTRDELTKLIARTIVAETSYYDGEGPAIADAVLALLRGEQ